MKILILSLSNLENDPRVRRQISFLCKDHEVYTAGLASSLENVVDHFNFKPLKVNTFSLKLERAARYKLGMHNKSYWYYLNLKDYSFFESINFDLIISNDFSILPFAVKIKGNAKILLDAHEYTPRQMEDRWNWRFFEQPYQKYIVKKYINKADAMLTVSPGIADEYFNQYGVKPVVMTNAAAYTKMVPQDVDPDNIKMIYHGYVNPSRNIEMLIDVMDRVDKRFTLHIMPVGEKGYINTLKELAKKNQNIIFHEPVSMLEIVRTINQYDIGLTVYPPVNFNIKNAMPNKFFEYIQARLMVISGPSPSMASSINEYGFGSITKDFTKTSLVKLINGITANQVTEYKNHTEKAAKELSSEKNMELLNSVISKMFRPEN